MTDVEFRLDKLYNTEAVVTLPDGSVVTVRVLTDAEVQIRELAATKAAGAVERQLRDKDSEEYEDLIAPLQQLDRDGHEAIVMSIAAITMSEEVQREYAFRYIPFPDDATEEERRETLEARDEHEARIQRQRSEELSRRLAARREELKVLDEDTLRTRAESATVRTQAFNDRLEEFYCQTVYMSCRDSKDAPAFDLESVRRHGKSDGLNGTVYRRLLDIYTEIDIADPWVLQKHP
ncbi:MAG: hypothetical protein GWN93_05810 [Deltaproteobacteria bacterium]|nr:hypothetical protein [Deltaproteobacteria bacterium]